MVDDGPRRPRREIDAARAGRRPRRARRRARRGDRPPAAGSCWWRARPGSARPCSCAASARATPARRGSCGASATGSSRSPRSARWWTSPRSPAASSPTWWPTARRRMRWPPPSCATWPADAGDRRLRGRALGRRRDARRAAPARPPRPDASRRCSSPATATTSSTAAIRCGSRSASSRAARRPPAAAGAAVDGGRRRAGRAARRRRRRAAPPDGRQPVLRHRGARRRRRRAAGDGPRRRAGARRAAQPARAAAARRRRDRARDGRAAAARGAGRRRRRRHLEECLSCGVLGAAGAAVAFRHDLARVAVEEALAPDRRLALHRRALAALAGADPARLAYHAEGAGDADAVLRFAPAAAERAAAAGAHREAAAQYARALRFGTSLEPAARAALLERRSHECYIVDQPDEAIAELAARARVPPQLGDRRGEGDDAARAVAHPLVPRPVRRVLSRRAARRWPSSSRSGPAPSWPWRTRTWPRWP